MKKSLKEILAILDVPYRHIADEANVSYNAIFHLTQERYKPSAKSRLKVGAALNIIRLNEIDSCMRKINQLKERVDLLNNLEIDI